VIRVRHYSGDILNIRTEGFVRNPGYTVFEIYAEYPITTPRRSPDLREQYNRFRPVRNYFNGIVEFNVDLNRWAIEPAIRDGPNAIRINVTPNLYGETIYMTTGFPLNEPGVDPEYFDEYGNPLP
jgi:hypothetical protein